MIRLFAKISVSILLAFALSSFVAGEIGGRSMEKEMRRDIPPGFRIIVALVDELKSVLEKESLENSLSRVGGKLKIPMEIGIPDPDGSKSGIRNNIWNDDESQWLELGPEAEHNNKGQLFLSKFPDGNLLIVGPANLRPRPRKPPILTTVVAVFSIVLVTGFALAFPVVKRLKRLEEAAQKIGRGDLEARVADSSKDAVGQLAFGFNNMASRIKALLEDKTQLMQAVAHELKTPISRARFQLEMLSSSESTVDRKNRETAIVEELEELDVLTKELLVFMNYENLENDKSQRTVFEVNEVIVSQARRVQAPKSGKNVVFAFNTEDSYSIKADSRAFERVVHNILSNAFFHAIARVKVELTKNSSTLEIAVSDDGPGIPVADRKRVFEPFTRLDSSRNRGSGGVGLGLAIVSRIVIANNGEVRIEDSDLGGAKLIVLWPFES